MMILCSACLRHLFAGEATCPFCGLALAPVAVRPTPLDPSPDLSRAQRYAIGAAIAVSIAGAGCGGTQKTDTTDPSGGTSNAVADPAPSGGTTNAVADPAPSGGTTNAVAGPADGQQGEGGGQKVDDVGEPDDTHGWRRRGNPCTPDGQCPPYGCVFPDAGCDVVRA